MKKSLIKEIMYSKLDEYMRFVDDQEEELGDELRAKLSPELFKLHQRHVDIIDKQANDDMDYFFKQGFKLGLRIGIECLDE